MSRAILIAGLGFGDEGKGTTVQYLANDLGANLVVRYNGGYQAVHNVISTDGKHHPFSQFGSATLEGCRTHLSRFMLVEPHALLNEARGLLSLGVPDPLSLLTIDRHALLVTPYHMAANRLREISRGSDPHGTCGAGIGEAAEDCLLHGREVAPVVGDLEDPIRLLKKLELLCERKRADFKKFVDDPDKVPNVARRSLRWFDTPPSQLVEGYRGMGDHLNLVNPDFLEHALESRTAIFEGAQGVLLDQDFGFQPHTTWSDTTFSNAETLLNEAGFGGDIWKVGVMRSYMTRHGAGPLPTEIDIGEKLDQHNSLSLWQGAFRIGAFDTMLMSYALHVIGGVDEIVLTHTDQRTKFDRICSCYAVHDEDRHLFGLQGEKQVSKQSIATMIPLHRPANYLHQRELGTALRRAKPIYTQMPETLQEFMECINYDLQTPIGVVSAGPRMVDKIRL